MVSLKEKFQKLDPNDEKGIDELFGKVFKNILYKWSAIRNAAAQTPLNQKYELLKQYIENDGGTLRLDNNKQLVFQPKSVKDKSTGSQFAGGGTQGKTAMGGV